MGMTAMVSAVRSQVMGLVARRFTGGNGPYAGLSMLPDKILWPLHREGLDPIPRMEQWRSDKPVARLPLPFGMRAWLVTGYEPVRAVLGSVDSYSNDFGKFAGRIGMSVSQDPGGLGFADPPDHTRLRKMLTPEFTMRRLARLQPRIEAIVAGRLDALAATDGTADLWHDFALPIPALTICELLGVPYADREYFQELSTTRFDLGAGGDVALDAIGTSLDYIGGLIEQQRREPGDGLLGALIKAHGDSIEDRELAGVADGVLTGGLETSASMIALGALVLMTNPIMADKMRAGEDVDAMVEELLRYLSVVQVAFPRVAVKDVRIGDCDIRAGDVVMCSLSGADRDVMFGPDPHRIDASRPANRSHMAFGFGIHRCIGAELARMELRTAYPALVRRFPAMSPAVPPAELRFRRASIVFGVDSLPVNLK
ncbi:cytochrome P450 [Paractinoplanes ferrugineus]|uniref:Cytochrome P450 n=1 Tax=Paractinoplanes ferrugineus TaxID=113564 RepID=A0A919JEY8_9ACTN|nr:cytochrome P450 [Actinoplanes ferrugineus]